MHRQGIHSIFKKELRRIHMLVYNTASLFKFVMEFSRTIIFCDCLVISISMMDSNYFLSGSLGLFQNITPEIVQIIVNDSMFLGNSFSTQRNENETFQIVLTSGFIAIAEQGFYGNSYLLYTPISFDLKFQVIYEDDILYGQSQQSNVNSRKIGFKLFYINQRPVEIYMKVQATIEVWIKYLSKLIHQFGFHKLYKPLKKIGRGGFATVYEVERITDRKRFAAKAFSKANTINSDNPQQRLTLLNQLNMLRTFDSSNVIRLECIFQSQNSIYVVQQLLSAGQLHNRINKKQGNFSVYEVKEFMVGLARGLKHINQKRIMHRDIKPENIMMRSQGSMDPVIVDFGLAAHVDSNNYIFFRCGTPGYVAPEITVLKEGQKIEPTCDVFSAGAIFHILLTKKPLFEGKKFEQVYDNNKNFRFDLKHAQYSSIDPQAMDLLDRMLKLDPRERITADQMLNHPFLAKMSGTEMMMDNTQSMCIEKDTNYNKPSERSYHMKNADKLAS